MTDEQKNSKPLKPRTKGEAKRHELLDEAAVVLNRDGVSQTSLGLIAKNVGVSRAALYYYVDDQQDLVYQCYIRTCGQLSGLLEEAIRKHTNALEIIDSFVANALDENRPEFTSLTDVAFLRENQRSVILGLYKGIRASLGDVIAQGVEDGQLRPCHSRIAASVILGLITWMPAASRWNALGVVRAGSSFRQTIRETLRYGVAKDREEPAQFAPYDLSTFFTSSGSVFDAKARVTARRDALVAVASWLFNQKGVDATSLEEIASQVGVTKKVIYHNVGGKKYKKY